MIKTAEELRVKLEGKTDRSEIEAILNGATIGAMKEYVKSEGFDCTGYHTWKKADFVETIAVALMEDIAKEKPNSEAEPMIVSAQSKSPAEETKTTTAIRFVAGKQYYGVSETGRTAMYTVKKITPKFVTLSPIDSALAILYRYKKIDGVETVVEEVTPTFHYTIRADNPVDTDFVPVAIEKRVAHKRTAEEKDRARTNALLRKYSSETEWILRIYRDAMAFMTDEEYEKEYGYKPTTRDKVEEWLEEGEAGGNPEHYNWFDYCRGLNFKPRGCKEFKEFGDGYDYEIVKFLTDVITRIGSRLTEESVTSQPEALYEDDAYADDGGDNSAQEQDIPEAHTPDEPPAPVRRQHTMRVIMLANKYAEARGTAQAIRDGIKTFRKCIKMGTR